MDTGIQRSLKIVEAACAQYRGTLAEHKQIQAALEEITERVTSGATGDQKVEE